MSTSLYDQFVPVFIKYLGNLSQLLEKGAAFCQTKGIQHEELISYQLISDMKALDFQVQSCSNTAKFAVGRLGVTVPIFEDNEKTLEELQDRIKRTIELLKSVDPNVINGKENEQVIMETKIGNFRFTGQRYITEYIIPNFHFHLSISYCILRTQGVDVGALDYLNNVIEKIQ